MTTKLIHILPVAIVTFLTFSFCTECAVAQTGWHPVVVPTGAYRETIKATPIEMRPNRPLHFYGNTVRRRYYRSSPLPTTSDVFTTTSVLLRRRGNRR